MNNIQELIPFNTACDEFIAGRYILADVKIASLLKLIATDEKLTDIISSALKGYDFNANFEKAVLEKDNNFSLVLPEDTMQIIAFVFNLLYRFDNKMLNFYDFISKYFASNDGAGKEFYNFADNVIIPFKEAINNAYSNRHIIVDTSEYQNNYYNKIKTQVKLILSNVDSYKLKMNEKEEFTMLLNSLYLASDRNDKKMVYSIMIGLDYFTKYYKKTRSAYLTLEECFGVN